MMKQKIILLFSLLLFTCPVWAQTLDSLKILDRFENYEFSNTASVQEYLDLFLKYENDVSAEDRITFGTKGAEAAAVFKNDSLYIDFYLQVIKVYAVHLYDVKKTRELLRVIADKVASFNDDLRSGNYNNLMGITYHLEGDYKNALDYYEKSYQFAKKIAPQKARGNLYNIRNIYYILGDSKSALKYSEEALSLNAYLPERDVYFNTAEVNLDFGTNYEDEGNQDTAFYFIQKALAAIDHLDSLRSFNELQTYCEVNLETLIMYSRRGGDQPKVDSLLKKVAKCKGRIEPIYSIYMADYYLTKGEFDKVAPLIADTSIVGNNVWSRNRLLKIQTSYEEGIGNYKKALELHKKYMDLNLEIRDEEKSNYATFISAQFDAIKRDAEIAALKQKTEAENLKSRLLIFAVLLLLTSLLTALYAYRKSKQSNSLLKSDLENKQIIEKQAEELKKTEALKSKLFTNISHELRTPLTLISGPIERILKKVDIDDTDKKQLLLARNSSRQLLSLSEQIMDLTKSEVGEVKLKLHRFHWDDFLDSVVPMFSANAENRNLAFTETKHYKENILIQSDLIKLKTVLNNLVQNAFKFCGKDGEVHLDSTDKGDQLEFSVKDNGRGIDKADLPHVFKRYYQSKNNTEAEGGFGIGLAVCQEYVKLLGGEITIKSNLGEGTTVTVSLPKTIAADGPVDFYPFDSEVVAPIAVAAAVEHKIADEHSAHLLIVEDNADLSEYLRTVLSDEYTLSFARNGEEALEKLEEINPSLVVTDWMMPVMDGLEFVEKLREDSKWQKLPVLMLTARSLPTDQLKAFQKGIDDYLLKPFEVDALKLRIEHLLEFAESRKEASSSTMDLDAPQTNSHEDFTLETITKADSKDVEWITQLEAIIQSQIGNFDLNIDSVSQEMGISNTHLRRKVKAITGLTPMQFIDEIRFWEARRILEEKEQNSVKALAYTVGFKSVKNFSRNFKKRFGKYPSEYF